MYIYPATDRFPHEPLRVRAPAHRFAPLLALRVMLAAFTTLATLALWIPFCLGALIWGWPPHQFRPRDVLRLMATALTARPPAPGIPPLTRAWILVRLWQGAALIPMHGLAWFLDEVLFRGALASRRVESPLVLLSAARSGSTQIAHYLEDDPSLVAPSLLQAMFPYLWLWRLGRGPLGRVIGRDRVVAFLAARVTEEYLERHEFAPFRSDTLEVGFYMPRLLGLTPLLGPAAALRELDCRRRSSESIRLWNEEFPRYVDGLGRRALAFSGGDAAKHRLFIKGHFLGAADALARLYPDARFLNVLRDPIKRIESTINHLHGNPIDEAVGAVPWTWLGQWLTEDQSNYCEVELAWFSRPDGPRRTTLQFTDYVADLEGTMALIYRECLDQSVVPPHVPRQHPPRQRSGYRVARTLEEVGIDREQVARRLADYQEWVSASSAPPSTCAATPFAESARMQSPDEPPQRASVPSNEYAGAI